MALAAVVLAVAKGIGLEGSVAVSRIGCYAGGII